nr:IclR family transcriptional regulator C-terminal domain-containing protein [Pseudonocardia sp. C8]
MAARLGETVTIAIPDRGYAVNVEQARGSSVVTAYNWLGRSTPLHNTSSGKVLLTAGGAADPDALAAELPPDTRLSPGALRALATELTEIAAHGYAWALEEYEPGLHAVAAPVRDHDGTIIAALSVSGPSYRLPAERLEEITPDVVAAGHEISRRFAPCNG